MYIIFSTCTLIHSCSTFPSLLLITSSISSDIMYWPFSDQLDKLLKIVYLQPGHKNWLTHNMPLIFYLALGEMEL